VQNDKNELRISRTWFSCDESLYCIIPLFGLSLGPSLHTQATGQIRQQNRILVASLTNPRTDPEICGQNQNSSLYILAVYSVVQ
jgi:hypothetical protein